MYPKYKNPSGEKIQRKEIKIMKKITRKVIAFFAAAIMVLAMALPAMAQNVTYMGDGATENGSITITNATVGKTYSIYKLFDAKVDAASGAITYTLPDEKSLDNNNWFEVNSAGNVVEKSGVSSSDVSSNEFKAWAKTFGTEISKVVATETTVTFDKIPYGYYYVESTLGGKISVTSTNPNAEIIDKNQGPSWDNGDGNPGKVIVEDGEKVTKNSAAYGDTVQFDIGVNAVNYNGDKKIVEYYITDTLGSGFTYVDANKDNIADVSVKIGLDTLNPNAYQINMASDGQGFEITIPWYDAETGAFLYSDGGEIHVTYSATVDKDAVIAGEGNKNTANFTFKEEDKPDKEPYTDTNKKETTTYVYALGLHKIDGENYGSLAGAKFSVNDSNGNPIKAVGSNGVYEYSTDTDADSVFETDSEGKLVIKGVKKGTYSVIETKAPDGYNKLTSPVSIIASLNETSTYTKETTTYYDADGNVVKQETSGGKTVTTTYPVNVTAIEVVNNAGSLLPSTGGIGTTVFYILGGILAAVAGICIITRRRMNAGR